jgi:hypothetical protein
MAVFKPLKIKEKKYVFKVFGNEKQKNPAKAIFKRFPMQDELFPVASQKSVMESIKDFANKEELVKTVIDIMMENIMANRFDFSHFLSECISHFEDFEFDGKEIKTIGDFLNLPIEAVEKISRDLYFYSKIEDEFTFIEKKT